MLAPNDHVAARDALLATSFATDRRDWDTVQARSADSVHLNYTCLNSSGPSTIDAGNCSPD